MTRARLPAALLPLSLTYLAVAMNLTVANVALPAISVDLDATATQLTWIVSSTPLVSAAFILFAGGISDRIGRRVAVLGGLTLFFVTALASGFATDPNQLIAMRGLTGVASAMAMPAALALVFSLTVGAAQRTAVGMLGATQAIGALVGPILAGAAMVVWGWPAAFWSVTPILLLAWLWLLFTLPRRKKLPAAESTPPKVDVWGGVLAAVLGASVVFATIVVASASRTDDVLGLFALALAVVAAVGLWWWERRVDQPMFIGSVLRRRSFWVPTLTIMTVQFTLGGLIFLSQQYLQLVLGLSPLGASLMLVPALITWAATSVGAGLAAKRLGANRAVVAGVVPAAVGLLILSGAGRAPHYFWLVLALLLTGAMGVAPALMTHTAVSNYPEDRRSVGSAINGAATRFGLALGIAAFASIASLTYRRGVDDVLAGVPASEGARESLGGALKLASSLPAGQASAVTETALDAFVAGFRIALLSSSLVLFVLAIVVWRFLPGTLPSDQASPEGASTS